MATSTTVNPGTQRKDAWGLEPFLTLLGLGGFGVYATWSAFNPGLAEHPFYTVPGTQYLSPFFSPNIYEILSALGVNVKQFITNAGYWMVTPGLFILWAPAGFRTTCYYYRKAYYRAFFTSPTACAVGETSIKSPLRFLLGQGKHYMGEKVFPMVLQNLHRYFFYVAALFILILAWDAFASFFAPGWTGLRVGLGSLVFSLNVVLLALYTFSCHSWRHLLGGRIDCFSCSLMGNEQHHAWERQSKLNEHHMLFAWLSLFSVGFSDLYIRMITQFHWFNDPILYQLSWKGGV